MTSGPAGNLPPDNPTANGAAGTETEEPKASGRVIGGWASNEDIYIVDRACLELGKTRAQFVVESSVERARNVLAAKTVLENRA